MAKGMEMCGSSIGVVKRNYYAKVVKKCGTFLDARNTRILWTQAFPDVFLPSYRMSGESRIKAKFVCVQKIWTLFK
jgi:hypothetical protein